MSMRTLWRTLPALAVLAMGAATTAFAQSEPPARDGPRRGPAAREAAEPKQVASEELIQQLREEILRLRRQLEEKGDRHGGADATPEAVRPPAARPEVPAERERGAGDRPTAARGQLGGPQARMMDRQDGDQRQGPAMGRGQFGGPQGRMMDRQDGDQRQGPAMGRGQFDGQQGPMMERGWFGGRQGPMPGRGRFDDPQGRAMELGAQSRLGGPQAAVASVRQLLEEAKRLIEQAEQLLAQTAGAGRGGPPGAGPRGPSPR